MPGVNYGPSKPTQAKRGQPLKMTLAPDVAKPKTTVKSKSKRGPGSQTDGVKTVKNSNDTVLKPVKPTGLRGLGTL